MHHFSGIKHLRGSSTDPSYPTRFAHLMQYAHHINDIYLCSWGPPSSFGYVEEPIKAALKNATEKVLLFMLCYVMLCYVMLCYVMLCYVMLCYVMLCYVMLCYVMLCYVMLCYVMLLCKLQDKPNSSLIL